MSREETPPLSVGSVGLATVVVVGLLTTCARRLERVSVVGTSMVPTFLPGDRLLVWRGSAYRAGDLVVARGPGPDAGVGKRDPRPRKRVDRARVRANAVVKRVVAVGEEGVVVAGDNPAASTDSRDYGPLPVADVRGRVIYRYAPAERAGRVPRRGPRRLAG